MNRYQALAHLIKSHLYEASGSVIECSLVHAVVEVALSEKNLFEMSKTIAGNHTRNAGV